MEKKRSNAKVLRQMKRVLSMVLAIAMLLTNGSIAQLVWAAPTIVSPEVNGNEVTFRTNKSSQYVNGSFNDWSGAEMTDPDGDGIYEYTTTLETGIYEYKFTPNWYLDPNNKRNNGNNNVVAVGYESPVVDGFTVTFSYYAPSATSVKLAGDTIGWGGTAMNKGTDGLWTYSYTYPSAGDYGYKFVVDGTWLIDPANPNRPSDNSVVSIVDASAPEYESPVVNGKEVTFNYYDTSENIASIRVVGDFNGWDQNSKDNRMTDENGDGVWSYTTTIAPGGYGYKILVKYSDDTVAWKPDAKNNTMFPGSDNSALYIAGLAAGATTVTKGVETDLGKQSYYNTSGGTTPVEVTYTLADAALAEFVTIDGSKITVDLACEAESLELIATIPADAALGAGETATVAVTLLDKPIPAFTSPVVSEDGVTFNFYQAGATNVYLVGEMNGWSTDADKLEKNEDGIFTLTLDLAPGKYNYKFMVDGEWTADPKNLAAPDDYQTDSTVIVSGLCNDTASATKGEVVTLPAKLTYYNAAGTKTTLAVTYTVAPEFEEFVLFDTESSNKATVLASYTGDEIEFIATAENGEKAVVTVSVFDKQYTYTIYAYSADEGRMSLEDSVLYIWDPVKNSLTAKEYVFTETVELEDGKTWLKAELDFGCLDLGIIFKSAGLWASDGGWQTVDMTFSNTEEKNCTLYLIDGETDIYESLDDIPTEDDKRYLVVEYTRADGDYTDMMVYTWATGYAEGATYDFEMIGNKCIVKIPVVDSTVDLNPAFIVKRGEGWGVDGDNKDGGDNFVTFPANQKIVKVAFSDGAVTKTFPYNSGATIDRENEKVNFFYRDDKLFVTGEEASLDGKVQVVVKTPNGNEEIDGTYDMVYDAAGEIFSISTTLVADTDYYYYYLVDGVVVLDAFNPNTITEGEVTYSKLRNKVYAVDLSASVLSGSMDYNQNNLLNVEWTGTNGASLEGFVVTELYADLSELGLGKAVAVDPELQTLTIACDQNIIPGTKTIKVTLKDDCGSTFTTEATVEIVERVKEAGDFDWDEAVIYFTVTDRFFDGREDNNTLVDNTNEFDGSRYHGGDFAGLKEKLDYLTDLGVNTIWITPIVENIDDPISVDKYPDYESYGYHGYWASDFTAIESHLGKPEELTALIEEAHIRDMKIMVDVVLNHAGYGTEEYFNGILDANMIRSLDETVKGSDTMSSLSGLPDFLTENEEVRNQLIAWQTAWMDDYDIDYYRVDTVKHVDKTTWSQFKNELTRINPEFKLIGEYYGANYTNSTEQLGAGTMDSLLDFSFKDYAKDFAFGKLLSVETILTDRNSKLSNTATLGQFLSSHDEVGLFATLKKACGGDVESAEALMKVAAALQITAKGQPVIYYGEEIGLTGENNYPMQDNRYDFDWEEVEAQRIDTTSFYTHYKTLLGIRQMHSEVFAKGDRSVIAVSDAEGYDVIRRSYNGKNIYIVFNVTDEAQDVTFAINAVGGSVYLDEYDGEEQYIVSEEGTVTVTVPAATNGGIAILSFVSGTETEIEDTNEVTVKLHYNRPDGDYTDWDAWMWGDKIGGNGYEFVEENGEMVATIKVAGRSESTIKYIVRKGGDDWKDKDVDADQIIDISDIVSGTVHFYVQSGVKGGTRFLGADAIKGCKIISSMYKPETNTVEIVTSVPVMGDINSAFAINRYDGVDIEITDVVEKDCVYTLSIAQDLTPMSEQLKSYILSFDGYEYSLGMPNVYSSEEFESRYTYDGDDLGVTWTKDATTFKVWAPTAEDVQLVLYSTGNIANDDCIGMHTMTPGESGVWSITMDGDLEGTYYTYLVTVNGETEEACDPYARTTGVNGKRAMVINLDGTDPEGWANDISPNKGMSYTDAIIYELHVRDASVHASSGVSEANKGKFLGLTETGTKTDNGVPTALDHIKDLGVTHVHLLPIYDYGSVDETKLEDNKFNWGYDPVNYNVPEGSYSTDPENGEVRVKEMKEMVMALHENNINVVMDVVYNHVYDAGSFSFNQIVPKYFSRTYADGSYSSGSGCGNDTASERSMVRKYIVESVLYWAEEYHIDGFRFDLVGLIDAETMNEVIEAVHAVNPDIIFYGEGWTMQTEVSKPNVTMATQLNASHTPKLAYFSDTIRNLLAGDNSATKPGYVSGLSDQANAIAACYTATTPWCPSPSQTVNYASCHDNYTLKDKLNLTRAEATEEDRIKMNNLAAAVYMMSEGIPFIHAGEEFLRTKIDETGEVIHNSYNSSDFVNALRWENIEDPAYADVVDYYKGLIEFRKNHESLRLTTKADVSANVTYHKVTSDIVLFSLKGKDSVAGEVSDGIVVIFNPTESAKTINLYNYNSIAKGEWKVCINAEDAGTDVLATITDGSVTVAPISAMVLVMGETVDNDSVYLDNLQRVSLDQNELTLEEGETATLVATATPEGAEVTWSSDNEAVATVDENGVVTAVSTGTAVITVTTESGMSVNCIVIVTAKENPLPPTQEELVRAFVERMYTIVLGRDADPNGLNDWAAGLIEWRVDGAEVVNGFVNSAEFEARNLSDEDFIKTLYLAVLNREADAAGLADWLRAFELGQTRQDLVNGFVTSAEFIALCDSYGILAEITQEMLVTNFAERMYTIALNREADEAGLADWVRGLMSGETDGKAIVDGFINSPEFEARNLSDEDYIKTLYLTILNREANAQDVTDWMAALALGQTRQDLIDGFIVSAEFAKLCGEYGIIPIITQEMLVTNFVERMYTVALGRVADEAGLNDWVRGLLDGVIYGAQVADGFIMSEEFAARGLSNEDYVKTLYLTFFDREAGDADVAGWVAAMTVHGQSRRDVLRGFISAEEFRVLCEEYGIIRGELAN